MNAQKSVLAKAVSKMLRPLVRILIRYGLSYSEFADLAKRLYVDVAMKDYALEGKKQTVSRVAVLTGLCRKETLKMKTLLEENRNPAAPPINRANRVILGWLNDAEFLDAQGKPAIVPLRGDNGSFDSLVKRYSGDITPRAILDELIRIGSVEQLDGDRLRLLTQGYIPETEEEKISVMAKCVSDQLRTIDFNLTHPSYESRFQRQIKYVDLPQETIKEFKEFSKERSIELIMEFNLWLSQKKKERAVRHNNEPLGQVGFGLYYFEEGDESEESSE